MKTVGGLAEDWSPLDQESPLPLPADRLPAGHSPGLADRAWGHSLHLPAGWLAGHVWPPVQGYLCPAVELLLLLAKVPLVPGHRGGGEELHGQEGEHYVTTWGMMGGGGRREQAGGGWRKEEAGGRRSLEEGGG